MNHAITIGELLLSLGVFGGVATVAFGLLTYLAAALSDAGDAFAAGKNGCVILAIGCALFVVCLLGLAA